MPKCITIIGRLVGLVAVAVAVIIGMCDSLTGPHGTCGDQFGYIYIYICCLFWAQSITYLH